jgi:hypothetical protein
MDSELIFRASPKKALLLLALSVGFVALGVWLLEKRPILGWVTIIFFSLGIPASVAVMLPGATYLRLDRQGFEIVAVFRRQKYRWSQVESFGIGSIRGNKVISIVFSPQYTGQRMGRAIASAVAGMEAAIPNHYRAPAEAILKC